MAPLKAPGPDGMPPLFYQNFWSLVGSDVTTSILHYLNTGSLPTPLNHTFITLIPKTKNPERVTEFRPICLCNELYKIFSKVLANRLKRVLPHLISEHQSAFLKGRLITDNILVAFETLHYMKNHTSGKNGFMALKLDMSKEYDRVEWSFLREVMKRMGFNEKWVELVMECVSTVTYSLLINGEPVGNIKPSRGIRQGDPLSPYLFLLCSEGLHRMIKKAADDGEIQGVSICRNGPKLTHLFFADDSLLFCRATTQECQKVLEILSSYERVSGQKLNRDKTSLFFSKSTSIDMQNQIMGALGVSALRQYEAYLGLPAMVGRNKRASFDHLKQRVWKKLQGWEGKLLSQAGREVLIKAVIQEIPTYTMSCFKLPTMLCHDIESLVRKFWWGKRGDRRKVHWVKWDDLCQHKTQGATRSWRGDVIDHVFTPAEAEVVWSLEWSWILDMQGSSVKEIFSHALAENKDVELLAFTGWAVWNRRNRLRFNEIACPLNQLLPLAKERKMEFKSLHPATLKMQHRNQTRWKPPDRDFYKVNYDGAVFEQQGRAGLGVIIRNSNGEVMASMC
ncbi:hypothetical protein SO802_023298 [Lithocarpus litseifolius]|uniref:Reverse transcriptase domain-containing protein n=1 Tax=Lithocarpus litseifolius TaxID=425828 RepID=A0AAW2C9A8_9ROSI